MAEDILICFFVVILVGIADHTLKDIWPHAIGIGFFHFMGGMLFMDLRNMAKARKMNYMEPYEE